MFNNEFSKLPDNIRNILVTLWNNQDTILEILDSQNYIYYDIVIKGICEKGNNGILIDRSP